ncbi:hypothetical protein [Gallionella capsiferriformans]|uniref:Uncharacterized protein n=1 Tax=Gallionella capsiferriformans (strain ES-2) TaxID=395494 RepID=D9SG82_GALCS|nr:hypothetical protein [Gallionella capsiferriformans]ADL55529.1 hypothetical protein Galf_1510 [Gallionella capsiferriformans ES-2]
MIPSDFLVIRRNLAALPSDHDASGQNRPTVDEIFTPEQHANALDPNTPVVVGARGTGKSFWAGVLEHDDTRAVAALAYPNLGLDRLIVQPGYTGFDGDVTSKTIDARVPAGKENETASDFWLAVIMRSTKSALNPNDEKSTIRALMEQYADPEDWYKEIKSLDERLTKTGKTLLITFDALDTISREWKRSGLLLDALFEVIWSLRARRSIRAKIFIRPEQLSDDSLRFVELPKLRSGRVELDWTQVELYGLLFRRLSVVSGNDVQSFSNFASQIGAPISAEFATNPRRWSLVVDSDVQRNAMILMAGTYMGSNKRKGGTYDWPYKHLADANGKVTPRSFIKLFVEAAKFRQAPVGQVISAEGIRQGLREASKVRVDQLGIEYQWVKRALAPLAGLTVPCTLEAIADRWTETNTIKLIMDAAASPDTAFLPPFPPQSKGDNDELLATAMERIGLFSYRADSRIDIPDLFRVAAMMLKRGGTTPTQKK